MNDRILLVKLVLTVVLVLVGCGLLIAGLVINPAGEIHNSVLVAFGEILTFAGTVLGMNYNHSIKMRKLLNEFSNSEKKKNGQASHDDRPGDM